MKLFLALLMVAALGLTAAAADVNVTGKWSGSFVLTTPEGETQNNTAYIVLKQNGKEITGTGGPNENEQWPIRNGRIEGNRITGEVQSGESTYKLDLVAEKERISGVVTAIREGQSTKAKLDVTRVQD